MICYYQDTLTIIIQASLLQQHAYAAQSFLLSGKQYTRTSCYESIHYNVAYIENKKLHGTAFS